MHWCRCNSHHFFQLSSKLNRIPSANPLTLISQTTRNSHTLWNLRPIHQHQLRSLTFLAPLFQSTKDDKEDEAGNKSKDHKSAGKALVSKDFFDSLGNKSKDTFLIAIDVFINRDKHARGHVEFILSALKHMKGFGVHRDLDAYKKLIDVFPKGKFIASNLWQVEFMHFPKQQECAIQLLEQMEIMGVMPDSDCEERLINIFGNHAFPLRKFRRMMYWMPKFKNLSPWPVPDPLPEHGLEIAKLAIERITSVDLESKVTTFFPLEELQDSIDPTWIVSGQSLTQQKLIEQLPADKPIYVEGAFRVWLRRCCINYFILRTEPKPIIKSTKDPDDVGFIHSLFAEDYVEKEVVNIPSVHEQEDGVILAVCATGTSSLDSILSWIRYLERTNPRLGKDISVLFTLKSPLGPTDNLTTVTVTDDKINPDSQLEGGSDPTEQSLVGSGESREASSMTMNKNMIKNSLTFDPANPQLSQVGIDADSDTKFLNWPHHYRKDDSKSREAAAREKADAQSNR